MKILISLFTILLIYTQNFAQTWQDVGGGTNNSSHGLLTWDGKLIDLGSFNNPCNRVAAWNGTSWECLGGGVGIVARAGTVWNGNLVVVGDFWNVQQPCTNCNGVAMWDGTQWTNIGAGFNNDVLCVTVWNGDLVVAGDFTQSNGVACSRIAKWNGTSWEQIGPSGAFNNDIRAITEFEGELWIGGDFTNVGGCTACDRLVKWSGTAWVGGDSGVDITGGVDNTVRVLYVNPYDGKLYMGGHFIDLNLDGVINTDCKGVAVYDGSNWAPLGTGVNDYVRAIHEYNGNIVVGGYFTTAGGVSANRIAKWNPTALTWSAMGLGFNGAGIDEYVKAATVWNGIFFAGGAYTVAESNSMNYIAQWYEVPAAIPTATINAEQTSLCTGGCFSFTDESTYGPTSWLWSFPGGSITSSTMQDPPPICYNTAGAYTVTLQACNSNGCNTTTQNITVTSGSSVTVNSPTICSGSSTVLTANPSTSGGTFSWSPGGETTSSITVSPTSSTSYTVTLLQQAVARYLQLQMLRLIRRLQR
jgi:PKD repeat protein